MKGIKGMVFKAIQKDVKNALILSLIADHAVKRRGYTRIQLNNTRIK